MREFKNFPPPVQREFARLAEKHGLMGRSNRVANTTTPGQDAVVLTFFHNKERIGTICLSWDMRGRVTNRSVVVWNHEEETHGNDEEGTSQDNQESPGEEREDDDPEGEYQSKS